MQRNKNETKEMRKIAYDPNHTFLEMKEGDAKKIFIKIFI